MVLAALHADFRRILIEVAGLLVFADFGLPIFYASPLPQTVVISALCYLLICLLTLIVGSLPDLPFLPPLE